MKRMYSNLVKDFDLIVNYDKPLNTNEQKWLNTMKEMIREEKLIAKACLDIFIKIAFYSDIDLDYDIDFATYLKDSIKEIEDFLNPEFSHIRDIKGFFEILTDKYHTIDSHIYLLSTIASTYNISAINISNNYGNKYENGSFVYVMSKINNDIYIILNDINDNRLIILPIIQSSSFDFFNYNKDVIVDQNFIEDILRSFVSKKYSIINKYSVDENNDDIEEYSIEKDQEYQDRIKMSYKLLSDKDKKTCDKIFSIIEDNSKFDYDKNNNVYENAIDMFFLLFNHNITILQLRQNTKVTRKQLSEIFMIDLDFITLLEKVENPEDLYKTVIIKLDHINLIKSKESKNNKPLTKEERDKIIYTNDPKDINKYSHIPVYKAD